jgi:hypothetical protein
MLVTVETWLVGNKYSLKVERLSFAQTQTFFFHSIYCL